MRVLIVDDSRAMRTLLGRFTMELGFETSSAAHGQEALDKLQMEQPPDLLLCDWNMPTMNGLDLVKAVRADAKNDQIKIVMCTTETETATVILALEAGANEYLMKPFTRDALQAKLEMIGLTPPPSE